MFKAKQITLIGVELTTKLDQLHHSYLPMALDKTFHRSKVNAIKKLDYILKHVERRHLSDTDFQELLLCSLTLVYYFGMRLKLRMITSRFWYCCGKKQFHKADKLFHKSMELLQPDCSESAIRIILAFLSDVALWPFESFVSQILEVVLYYSEGKITLFNIMLSDIHNVLFLDVTSARHRMRVLYELLKSTHWNIDNKKLVAFVTRLLDFFAYSIGRDKNKAQEYGYLRKGFEVCLRRIFERVENNHRFLIIATMLNWFAMVQMIGDDALEFSSLLDHAAMLYEVGLYSNSFQDGVFEHVVCDLVGSSNSLHSLIGSRLLQRLLDRQNNAPYLMIPTLYYEFSQVHLKIGVCEREDKTFIRHHRQILHENLLMAMKLHGCNTSNLNALFSVICLLILEVPCGLTAAAAACMVMAMQDYAIKGENLSATCRYWLHAIVISIMTLICWVHKAPVLYRYVNQIISRRAKEAPQLNPPLMQNYNLGRHHITWNKPTLFFEDWELRYGLWKHFQVSRDKMLCLTVLMAILITCSEGRMKKVVIHVPYKVKKIKHTHTVYKTIHHHHAHPHLDHAASPSEDHEHFHHVHLHEEPPSPMGLVGQHSQPVPGLGIPEFLPDVPMEVPDIPDVPHDLPGHNRLIPLYRRT